MYKRVYFTTIDGVIIHGAYYQVDTPKGHALLLHMMPAVKESWQELAQVLNAKGLVALAIDFRGHGESIKKVDGTVLNYKNFSDAEQQAKLTDIRAAVDWLHNQGASDKKLALVGASIGANLSLQYLGENNSVPTAVLLSPGIDYRGIQLLEIVPKIRPNQSFLCVAAADDEYSYNTCVTLTGAKGIHVEKLLLDVGGHGTDMFSGRPDLIEKVVAWVGETLK